MKNDNIDQRLFTLLDDLGPVPGRDPHAEAHGRAQFLREAVSLRGKQRHNVWTIFQHKENLAMKLAVSTLVIVGLLFGGNATVSAAQDDLPNQPLYPVKVMSEDVSLWFVSDPVQEINILLEQAQNRFQEMEMLSGKGIVTPDKVQQRAQERIERALQLATQLDEASQPAALQHIQIRLRAQEQLMQQLEQGTCTDCVPVLQRTREMLQLQLRAVERDIANPDDLPHQNQNQNQDQTQNQLWINQTPQPTGTAMHPTGTCTPVLNGTGPQNGSGSPLGATPVQQQNQNQQRNQNGGGTQNDAGPRDGGGSSTGSGGQGGKP